MFTKILNNIELIENNKEAIVNLWMDYEVVQDRLNRHDLDINSFEKNFANEIFNFALSVVKSENKIGNCPIMNILLMLFKKKNIPLTDVFIICVNLKNAMLQFTCQNDILDNDMIDEISMLMDYNFEGVIDKYTSIYYNNR